MKVRLPSSSVALAGAVFLGACGGGDGPAADAGADAAPDGAPDGAAPSVSLEVLPPSMATTELAEEAVAAAPSWLRGDLRASLVIHDEATQDTLARLVLSDEEPRARDEIAFTVAHLAPEHVLRPDFYPELVVDNALSLHRVEPFLDYAEIVDYGDPEEGGDYHSTVRYRTRRDGELEEVELPRDVYYWYVVHPVIEDEAPTYVDPSSGRAADPPAGRFWRDYLFFDADEGYAPLADYLEGVDVSFGGLDHASEGNGAVGRIIEFVQDALDFDSGRERPVQPVRVYSLHCGRCGEHQDLTSAAARAALIPCLNVSAWANDHVWNELWDGRWIQWEPVNTYVEHYTYYADAEGNYHRSGLGVDNDCDGVVDEGCDLRDPLADGDEDGVTRGDGDCDDTRAAVFPGAPEVADGMDNDCDGIADEGAADVDGDGDGVTIAEGDCNDRAGRVHPDAAEVVPSNNRNFAVSATRGDGLVWTVTERYAGVFTLEVEVVDEGELPVDGATVVVAGYSTTYPDSPGILIATWAVTDMEGRASFELGEANEYYLRVESPLGSFPAEEGTVTRLFDDPVRGEERSRVVRLTESIPAPAWTDLEVEPEEASGWSLAVDFDFAEGFYSGANYFTGLSSRQAAAGLVDVVVVDDDGLEAFDGGEAAGALTAVEGRAADSLDLDLPDHRAWYVVLTPSPSLSGTVHGGLTVTASHSGEELGSVTTELALVHGDRVAVRVATSP